MTSLITGRRAAWALALVPFLLALALIGAVGEGDRASRSTDSLPAGLDSTEGAALLDRLPQDVSTAAVVLFTAVRGQLSGDQLAVLRDAAPDLATGPATGPAGEGAGQFPEILAELKARNWSGVMTLEPHLNPANERYAGLSGAERFVLAVQGLRRVLDAAGLAWQ